MLDELNLFVIVCKQSKLLLWAAFISPHKETT